MLIKPQFEVGREKIGEKWNSFRGKISRRSHKENNFLVKEEGYTLFGIEMSPIKGTKGNVEFLALIYLGDESHVNI